MQVIDSKQGMLGQYCLKAGGASDMLAQHCGTIEPQSCVDWHINTRILSIRCASTIVPHFLNLYSAGIDFSRQNLTSVDVRFGRLKSITAL